MGGFCILKIVKKAVSFAKKWKHFFFFIDEAAF